MIPKMEEHITIIHRCLDCKLIKDCEAIEIKKAGWCYTFKKINLKIK